VSLGKHSKVAVMLSHTILHAYSPIDDRTRIGRNAKLEWPVVSVFNVYQLALSSSSHFVNTVLWFVIIKIRRKNGE